MFTYNRKNKKSKIKEGQMSHIDTINNLSDQMKKFILKHKNNPNSVVNDVSISIFLSFSEAFSQDSDLSTNGLNMLQKLIEKLKVLMKEYDDLVPEEGNDFDLESDDIEDMQTTLDSDLDDEEDDDEESDSEIEEDSKEYEEEDEEEDEDY